MAGFDSTLVATRLTYSLDHQQQLLYSTIINRWPRLVTLSSWVCLLQFFSSIHQHQHLLLGSWDGWKLNYHSYSLTACLELSKQHCNHHLINKLATEASVFLYSLPSKKKLNVSNTLFILGKGSFIIINSRLFLTFTSFTTLMICLFDE